MGTQRVRLYQEPEKAEAKRPEKVKKEEKIEKKEVVEVAKEKPKVEFVEKPKVKPLLIRGKKWQKASELFDKTKTYPLSEALDLVKKTAYSNFDSKVEVHIRLWPKKGQTVRGTLVLPFGPGKEPKVAIFSPELLPSIEKGKIDFDVLLAKPSDMPLLSKVAKILGPKGLMPNPKSGTIANKPEEVIKKIKTGQIEYKTDPQNNLHQIIGKVTWETEKLEENFKVLMDVIRQYNPISVTVCSTMGPGIKVDISHQS